MKIDRAALRKTVVVTMAVTPADESYKTALEDPAARAWVEAQLVEGNEWAWFDVTVTATYVTLTSSSSMGSCSYESQRAFLTCPYYEELVNVAVEDLAAQLEQIASSHDIWEHDRVVCIRCASTTG